MACEHFTNAIRTHSASSTLGSCSTPQLTVLVLTAAHSERGLVRTAKAKFSNLFALRIFGCMKDIGLRVPNRCLQYMSALT